MGGQYKTRVDRIQAEHDRKASAPALPEYRVDLGPNHAVTQDQDITLVGNWSTEDWVTFTRDNGATFKATRGYWLGVSGTLTASMPVTGGK